jgi:hypothetical protein
VHPPAEGFDRGQERAERLVDIGQAALVGDRLRQLEDETEVSGGLPGGRASSRGDAGGTV